jgi:hypothetical protein
VRVNDELGYVFNSNDESATLSIKFLAGDFVYGIATAACQLQQSLAQPRQLRSGQKRYNPYDTAIIDHRGEKPHRRLNNNSTP